MGSRERVEGRLLSSPDYGPAREDDRWSGLVGRASERGAVPVIVTLAVDFVPEGDLPTGERAAQQERIAEASRSLLAELEGTHVENVFAFDAVPQVTMSVGPDALSILERSANVRYVAEDVPSSFA